MTHDEVVDMKDFNEWWNADIIRSSPFRKGSPKYWGWAAWQAAVKAEREACAKTIESLPLFAIGNQQEYEKATIEDVAKQIRARGQA
jgi:hypothetical protein